MVSDAQCLGGELDGAYEQGEAHRYPRLGINVNPASVGRPAAPSTPGTPRVGQDFFLDEDCPARGFVSVTPSSLAWKDKVGKYEVKLTQGLAVSLHAQYSWTIPSGAWTHRRALFKGEPEELVRVFHNDRLRQEALEKQGHCSPK